MKGISGVLANLDGLPVRQQPNWPDPIERDQVLAELSKRDTLVYPRETDLLTVELGKVANGEAFLLQAGDCAESFASGPVQTENLLKVIFAMNMVISYASGLPVVKLGRMAGQYGKPRSSDTEEVDGITIPSFRGEITNGPEPNLESRTHDPRRMIRAYDHSMQTLHTIHGQTQPGGVADLDRMLEWNIAFNAEREEDSFNQILIDIERAIKFMKASGVTDKDMSEVHTADVYTSHEALVLDYEKALTHQTARGLYAGSAHSIWIGERTRNPGEQHVAFCAQVQNPIGVKIGPTTTRDEILRLCEILNPNRIAGRLTLISRMGAGVIRDTLPPLIQAVQDEEQVVAWIDDPMHGNTVNGENGRKTRHLDTIKDDIDGFFEAHENAGTWPGGVHLEMTGDNVTECIGGTGQGEVSNLELRYETTCDPRINGAQGVELAHYMVPRLQALRSKRQIPLQTNLDF